MRCRKIAFSLLAAPAISFAAEPPRPRGVGPDFAKFYKSADTFTCISNPTFRIPFNQVNDDYCDCPDGSDEPGTAACSYLSSLSPRSPANLDNVSAALPGFYCKNKGHNPAYLSFINVNDGICDYDVCCDGSDEWENASGVKCEDKCKEIGKEWKKNQETMQKALTAAAKKRKELVTAAAKRKQEIADGIKTLTVEIEASEVKLAGLEEEVVKIEESERKRVVRGTTSAGKAGILAGLAKARIHEYRDALRKLQDQRDDYSSRMMELEGILRTFKEEYNPNFNDEGVKRAARDWEQYEARQAADEEFVEEEGIDEIATMMRNDGIEWEEFEQSQEIESDTAILYQFEEYIPPQLRAWVHEKLRDLRTMLEKNGIIAQKGASGSTETKAVRDSKERLKSSKSTLEDQRREKTDKERELTNDYGKDDVFRTLKDTCISLDSGEYTYELCWLGSVTQKSKKGGQHSMGRFSTFGSVIVDESLPLDGKGLGSGERISQKYDNGAHCWNGPNRETTVVMACAEQEEVWKVTEEEKCIYRMEVGTPAACDSTESGTGAQAVRDEL